MIKHCLKLIICLTILCQAMHALGLCSVHVNEVCGENSAHSHSCPCSHEADHYSHSDHPGSGHGEQKHDTQPTQHSGQQPGHCGDCCSVESKTVPPPRTSLQNVGFDLSVEPLSLNFVFNPIRFANLSKNAKPPFTQPLYISHCALLI